MLSIGGEDEVLLAERASRADLGRLLAQTEAHSPSSPWRCRAVASVSTRRVSTMSW